ncbi:MAG: hypothetical protein J5973_07160 [Eubacterium sp.]|nr:hypothetical protein [Eubacterium sp.]
MQKVNLEELESVAGGVNSLAGTEAAADLTARENQAAVMGMGTSKLVQGTGMGTENTRTVKAYCSVCGKKTMFYLGSGAQSKCSVCGNIRLDL